jgi:hypothetical protein|tara:strand:- start:3548 stop:3895 length:348 start_codon:yes stop_codon:yes gene_type:complete
MIEFSFKNEVYDLGGFEIILKPCSSSAFERFNTVNNPTNESMYEANEAGQMVMKDEFWRKHYDTLTTFVQKFLVQQCVSIEGVEKDQWFEFFDSALDVPEFREFVEGYKSGQKKT